MSLIGPCLPYCIFGEIFWISSALCWGEFPGSHRPFSHGRLHGCLIPPVLLGSLHSHHHSGVQCPSRPPLAATVKSLEVFTLWSAFELDFQKSTAALGHWYHKAGSGSCLLPWFLKCMYWNWGFEYTLPLSIWSALQLWVSQLFTAGYLYTQWAPVCEGTVQKLFKNTF